MSDKAWEKEWVDMPEFLMEDITPERKIIVSFRNEGDVQTFAALLGQQITPKQKYLWFPDMPKRSSADKRYVDEETAPDAEDLTPRLKGGFFK